MTMTLLPQKDDISIPAPSNLGINYQPTAIFWAPLILGCHLRSDQNPDSLVHGVTPQKSNIDTKELPCLKGVAFSKPSFWVSMLVYFRGCILLSYFNKL